ncbi:MAG: FtsX-like permease family protein [Acidobacteria bacterium]|nr:FtsX-like permease family protein [Acidobacteriota bacterium]
MSTLFQDVWYGLRSLRSTPGVTAALLLVLILGIGSLVATFSLVEAALLNGLPYPDADRLVVAATTFDGRSNPVGSAPDWDDYRTRNSSFSGFGALMPFYVPVPVVTEREPIRANHIYVSWNLFATLDVAPQIGRNFNEQDAQLGATVAIVSHDFWQTQMGENRGAVGSAIRIDGSDHTVVGVMPAGFHFMLDIEVWRPMQIGGPFAGARRFHNWLMVGRLSDGVSMQQAQSDADAISLALQTEYPDTNETKALALTPLSEWMASSVRTRLLLMLATAALVLAVAGSNVASLLLARGSTRQAELAVRAALGASRARIVRQLTIESLVLGAIAGTGGLALAAVLRGALLQVVPLSLFGVQEIGTSAAAIAFGLGVTVMVSLGFGVAPVLRIIPTQPSESLRGGRTTIGQGNRLRSFLVVAQVATAVVLLIGSALLLRSFAALSGRDLGFDSEQLLSAGINLRGSLQESADERRVFFDQLTTRIEALPQVDAATAASRLPIRNPGNNIGAWDADAPAEPGQRPIAYQRTVQPGYFETMRIPLLEGRGLDPNGGDSLEFVISRSLAATLFPEGSAVGRRLAVDWGEDAAGPIVGVVEDVRVSGVGEGAAPTFYAPYAYRGGSGMNLAIRTRAGQAGVVAEVRDVVRQLDPTVPLSDVRWMDDLVADSIGQPRLLSMAMVLFAATALVLSLIGLYGLLAQTVAQRRREFGLRVAVGASSRDVLGIVVRSGMIRVGVGLVVGVGIATLASRTLETVLFEVPPSDPLAYAAVAALLGAVGLAACLVPAWRAVRTDPVVALRAE